MMRQQTITLDNFDPDLCHHVASLGHNEFPITSWIFMSLPTATGLQSC